MHCTGIVRSLGLLAGLLLPPAALALPVEIAIDRALARDAGLQELQLRARSHEQSAIADAALPDPQLSLSAEGLPIDDPLAADMMTMYSISLRQSFPPGQTRRLSGERGSMLARATAIDARARALEVALEVRLAWLAWAGAIESAARLDTMADQIAAMVELSERRFAAGSARQQDAAQARLEQVLMERRRLDAATAIEEARARLERWTGPLAGETPPARMPEWSQPDIANPDPTRQLAADLGAHSTRHLAEHPQLAAARSRVEAGQLGTEIARQAYRPEWMLEAGYGHQRGSDPMAGRMSDKLMVMASLSLPLFTAHRQDRRLDAALAERDAEEAQLQAIAQRLNGELAEQIALRQRLAQRRQLLEDDILPQAEEAVDATLSAYQADRASFDELIRARLQLFELELDLINTRERLLATIARIAALTNKDPT